MKPGGLALQGILVYCESLCALSMNSAVCVFLDVQDGKLSKEEIVNNVDLFAGSQATEWGQFMTRHDEF